MQKKKTVAETLYLKIANLEQDRGKIQKAAKLLQQGEVVAFPTETVYGLGAVAFNVEAVEKIYRAKGRPRDNPLIVHIASFEDLASVVKEIPSLAADLAARFWPGPLTLVLKAGKDIPGIITGGLKSVAVRVPDHPVALSLLKETGFPIVAPSANLSGRPSPTLAEHVLKDLNGRIAAILDGGPCRVGLESTVLDLTGNYPRVLRPGGVVMEDLKVLLPQLTIPLSGELADGEIPLSPGMKYRHYSPAAPLYLLEGEKEKVRCALIELNRSYRKKGLKTGLLVSGSLEKEFAERAYNLIEREVSSQATSSLFLWLREMDEIKIDVILAESIPERGLGVAVMNRLRKAAGNNIIKCN